MPENETPLVGVFGGPPPKEPGWLDRLLRRPRPDLAEQAIASVFDREGPQEVSESRISRILSQYNVTGEESVKAVTQKVFARALERFLQDDILTDTELAYLERLCRILDVGFDMVEGVKANLIHPRYKLAVTSAIKDGLLTPKESAFLEKLSTDLQVPSDIAKAISDSAKEDLTVQKLAEMVADQRISPTELADLSSLARNIGLDLEFGPELSAMLNRLALLWRIENGEIPEVLADINLQKAETCHFVAQADWHELRTITKRIDYAGPVAYIPIVKGFRYRIGSITPRRVASDELTHIDSGMLYITSKRVIFQGAKRNLALRLSSLIGAGAFSDGLMLEKATGRSPHFVVHGDSELAVVVLTSLLAR